MMIHLFTVPMVLLLGFSFGWALRGRLDRSRNRKAHDLPDLD